MKLLDSDGDTFRERVVSYADSIVRNDLPIALDEHGCSSCGATFQELVGLPIPDEARKEPLSTLSTSFGTHFSRRGQRIGRCGSIQCQSMKLKSRPIGRVLTKPHAVNEVCDRESVQDSFCSEDSIRDNDMLITDLLDQANHRQIPLCKADDDPFRNDTLTRLLEISPPASSDARMTKRAQDYMVSALPVLLDQHLRCHTKSCFKNSGVTPSDKYCRYRFPCSRVAKTSFDALGLELKRTLGHELMNGYNYELMATFKCNHDIQALLGGVDATERIHYCCKYITKPQKQLDSQVAVAGAALKRRQMRETADGIAASVAAFDRVVMSRRRVSAMVYNLTNRQEIAGPLAALYLYHGSCCYSSARCVSLPLWQVVRQLMQSEDYPCSLVNTTDTSGAARFRAVSYLDDYIFRPTSLKQVNLYEFTVWYFRKKHEGAVNSYLYFLDGHPFHKSHCLGKRYEEVVPVLQSFRLPQNEGNALNEKRWKYVVLALVLFKPFRCLNDLIGDSESSDQETWKIALSGGNQRGATARDEAVTPPSKPGKEEFDAGTSGDSDDDDGLFPAEDFDFDDTIVEEDAVSNNLCNLWDTVEDTNTILERSVLDRASCSTSAAPDESVAQMIDIFRGRGMLDYAARKLVESEINQDGVLDLPSVDLMKKWVKDASTDNALLAPNIPDSGVVNRDTEVVELLDGCLSDKHMEWKQSVSLTSSPKLTKNFVSIFETSRAYTLNEGQHYAFKAIGKALLSRWRQAETLRDPEVSLSSVLFKTQLLLFLGGEGGTGKSRIVDAVQAFCESWDRPQALLKAALTGKAATLIAGSSISTATSNETCTG
ncbi:unnamed protein product [Phytophthora lilii]|uniref:Unnamed protein product n=1 Tax=Phytophthora lilii TaxID=2077276 RepID=A0A9W6TIB8_9STRA|nr:unnamed protein product [Phytophthora lilii]